MSYQTPAPSVEEIWDLSGVQANLLILKPGEGRLCPVELQVNFIKFLVLNLVKSLGPRFHFSMHALSGHGLHLT